MVILSAFLALISLWALSSLLTCRVTLIVLTFFEHQNYLLIQKLPKHGSYQF